jgi:putative ABC transport system ATP-binding protein
VSYEVGVGILALTIPIGVQTVVNTLAFSQNAQPLVFLAFAVMIGQIAGLLLKATQIVILERLQKRLFSQIGMELAYRIPRMLRTTSVNLHELVNRFFDIVTIQKNLSFLIIEGFALVLQILIGLTLLAFYHPILLAFDIVLVFLILFLLFVVGRGAIATNIAESTEKYNFVSWLEQLASKSVTFSSKGARYFALERANRIILDYLTARDSHFKIVFRQVVGFLSLQAIANTSLLILGVWLVSNNQLTIGQLVAAEIVVSTVLYSFTRVLKHLDNFYDLIAAVNKVGYLLDHPIEQQGKIFPRKLGSGEFDLQKVEYDYGLGGKVLGPISFKLEKGMKLAIHGTNGSGKSTIVDLLFGFKKATKGLILYNGQDIRHYSAETLRENVSLVKGVEIVHGSILKNLKIANTSAPIEDLNEILNSLGLLSEFNMFPNGLDTMLLENGAPLSVSQTKRLMIARALIQKPDVLLIDETIDGLDDPCRAKVLDLIFSKSKTWTVLITSKHPEIEKRCDKVIDLDHPEAVVIK